MEVDPSTSADNPTINSPSASTSSTAAPESGDMGQKETGDFLQTGRVGRRNAVPDINTDASAKLSTADLPMELEKLSCSDDPKAGKGASTSKQDSVQSMDTTSSQGASGQQ